MIKSIYYCSTELNPWISYVDYPILFISFKDLKPFPDEGEGRLFFFYIEKNDDLFVLNEKLIFFQVVNPKTVFCLLSDQGENVRNLVSICHFSFNPDMSIFKSQTSFMAFVKFVIRCSLLQRVSDFKLSVGNLILDVPSQEVKIRNRIVRVSPIEFKLLKLLVEHKNDIVRSNLIIGTIWGGELKSHNLHSQIYNLKNKLTEFDGVICSVYGVGFSIQDSPKLQKEL